LGEILEEIGWPCLGIKKNNFYETHEDNLLEWKKLGYHEAEMILKYRKITKLRTAFIGSTEKKDHEDLFLSYQYKELIEDQEDEEGLVKFVQKIDNKIHPLYGVARTDSLRSKCYNPNLQQFPKQKE
jgi:DNA polymerase I-like protein with 3'-5' exonuclease and polymerase domains